MTDCERFDILAPQKQAYVIKDVQKRTSSMLRIHLPSWRVRSHNRACNHFHMEEIKLKAYVHQNNMGISDSRTFNYQK